MHSFFFIEKSLVLGLRLKVLIIFSNFSLKVLKMFLVACYSISINICGRGSSGQYKLSF